MEKLIQAEFIKLWGCRIFLLVSAGIGILLSIMIIIATGMTDADFGVLNGYTVFLQVIAEPQTQIVFTSLFAAFFIGEEFSRRTFDIGIISGCSRRHLFAAKAVVFLCGLSVILLLYPLVATGITSVAIGFGPWNVEIAAHLVRTILLSLISYWALGGFCIMMAMAVKNIGGIIGAEMGILLALTVLIQILANNSFLTPILRFLFLFQTMQVTQPESFLMFIGVCVTTLIVTLAAAGRIFERAELK